MLVYVLADATFVVEELSSSFFFRAVVPLEGVERAGWACGLTAVV